RDVRYLRPRVEHEPVGRERAALPLSERQDADAEIARGAGVDEREEVPHGGVFEQAEVHRGDGWRCGRENVWTCGRARRSNYGCAHTFTLPHVQAPLAGRSFRTRHD